MSELSLQRISPEHQKEQELHQKLIETLDNSIGLDDVSLRKEGYGELLDHGCQLEVRIGADGIYGHMVSLKIEADSENPDRDDFFQVNALKGGLLQVVAAREDVQGYLVRVNEFGRIIEGFPTVRGDMLRRELSGGGLSGEDAKELVEGVVGEFAREYDRRLGLLAASDSKDD